MSNINKIRQRLKRFMQIFGTQPLEFMHLPWEF